MLNLLVSKLICNRDVVFLEFDKDAPIIDQQISHLDKFTSSKFYYELENDFPHPEGGIPILDHPMDFLSITTLENKDSLNNNRDSNKRGFEELEPTLLEPTPKELVIQPIS